MALLVRCAEIFFSFSSGCRWGFGLDFDEMGGCGSLFFLSTCVTKKIDPD